MQQVNDLAGNDPSPALPFKGRVGEGSFTKTNIPLLITGTDEKHEIICTIYPVPNDGKFTISIESSIPQTFEITVFNITGMKIHEEKNTVVNGLFQKEIDLRPVSNGVYTISIQNSNSQITRKIVVHREHFGLSHY
jgi:hypothetical protein